MHTRNSLCGVVSLHVTVPDLACRQCKNLWKPFDKKEVMESSPQYLCDLGKERYTVSSRGPRCDRFHTSNKNTHAGWPVIKKSPKFWGSTCQLKRIRGPNKKKKSLPKPLSQATGFIQNRFEPSTEGQRRLLVQARQIQVATLLSPFLLQFIIVNQSDY